MGLRGTVAVAAAVGALGVAGCGDEDSDGDALGTAGSPENAIEFLGRLDQTAGSFTGYGYLTHVSGLDQEQLYAGGAGGDLFSDGALEDSARFTFRFETELTSRAVKEPLFVVDSEGTIEFFFNPEPAGDFDDPDSFGQGESVAEGTLSVQDVIDVYAPNTGIAIATGALTIGSVESFELDGESAELGEEGQEMRLFLTGQGRRSEALLPRAVIDFAGNLTVDGE